MLHIDDMAPGKDFCAGCEDLRPLLKRYQSSREGQCAHAGQAWLGIRPLAREDASILMRFVKHWLFLRRKLTLLSHVTPKPNDSIGLPLFKRTLDTMISPVVVIRATASIILQREDVPAKCRIFKQYSRPPNENFVRGHVACLFKSQDDIEALNDITLSFVQLGIQFAAHALTNLNRRTRIAEELRRLTANSAPNASSADPDIASENDQSGSQPSAVSPVLRDPPCRPLDFVGENVQDTHTLCETPVQLVTENVASSSKDLDDAELADIVNRVEIVDFSTWPNKELEEFSCFYHRVFLPNYPLYAAAKYSIQRDERNKSDPYPPYYLDTFTYWATQGGLSFLTTYFTNGTLENSTLTEAMLLVTSAFHVRHFVYFEIFTNTIGSYRMHVINYLLRLPLEELRKPPCRQIADMMWGLRKDNAWPHATFDQEGLDLAHKFFSCSSYLTLRLIGIQEINCYITTFNEFVNDLDPRVGAQLGTHFAKWILEKLIVEEIFGQNAHVELISRSVQIINFLSQHQCLSMEQLDCIWNAAQMNYISRQVFEMLPNVTRYLEPTLLMHLYKKLVSMEVSQHTEQSINVVASTLRTIWMYALHQKPVFGSPPHQRHQVETIPNQSASREPQIRIRIRDYPGGSGSSTDGTSGSTGSGSEEDSNSDGFDSDEDEARSATGKMPAFDTFYAQKPLVQAGKLSTRKVVVPLPPVVPKSVASHEETTDEGSSESCEEEEEEDPNEASTSAPSNSRVQRVEMDRKRRSPCPSGDSLSILKKQNNGNKVWCRDENRGGAIIEHLLSPNAVINLNGIDLNDMNELLKNSVRIKQLDLTKVTQYKEDMEDDVATQGSDCAEADLNSSTSDMSDKLHDLDADVLEASAEGDLADDEDDLDESSLPPELASILGKESPPCKIKILQLQPSRSTVYTHRSREIAYSLEEVISPGKTLLWDLLQEQNIEQISAVVAAHAEKELCNLLICMNNSPLAMKFVDACILNLDQHQTVCVSLRIMTRLIQSHLCTTASSLKLEDVRQVMNYFFKDLARFADAPPHHEMQKGAEIRARLTFLQVIYSSEVTEKKFRLDKEQLDSLWECLVVKLKVLDDLAQWLTTQLGGADQHHALSGMGVSQLFWNHLGKLESSSMTVTALKLFQLCLQFLTTIQTEKQISLKCECADRMWIYAMFGDLDVSELAIRHLNHFYLQAVRTHKQSVIHFKEQDLFNRSMEYITQAMSTLETVPTAFTTIIRCFNLMKKQIESYKQRFGFHLRLWQLSGCGVLNHNLQALQLTSHHRAQCFIHITLQMEERPPFEFTVYMLPSQYFGELRAEILFYIWKMMCRRPSEERMESMVLLEELYGFIQNRGPVHVVFHNDELTAEKDESSLHELNFRLENQVYVNFGGALRRTQKVKEKLAVVFSPAPFRDSVPMLLAASHQNFKVFFQLQEILNAMAVNTVNDPERENFRKQVSRTLWDFLMLIPTSDAVLDCIRLQAPRERPSAEEWREILPANSAHRLLYALQALENLYRDPNAHGTGILSLQVSQAWSDRFIASGGFARLYELLLLPQLQESGGTSDVVDQHRECLSNLIRLIFLFSIEPERVKQEEDSDMTSEESSDDEVEITPGTEAAIVADRKRKVSERKTTVKRTRRESIREGPQFKHIILELLDIDQVLDALLRIQYNAVLPKDCCEQRLTRPARVSRQNVVRLAFEFLSGWASCSPLVFPALSRHQFVPEWLRRLALESVDSAITAETCAFIERMCRLEPEYELSCALLVPLLDMMTVADGIKCLRAAGRDDKSPLRPSPRHYYEAISKLLEIIPKPHVEAKVDLDGLCEQLAGMLERRPCYEPRNGCHEDDGLIGLLKVATQVLSHNPQFKFRSSGMKMLLTIFSCLFDVPCDKKRDYPKCKSAASRAAAYSCLFEITRFAPENYMTLGRLLLKHHSPRNLQTWDYWPRDDTRSDCGFVGMTNLGATCYLATTMQHLFMIPEMRKTIIEAQPSDVKQTALSEMQRMFSFLLESERKAYSPEAFCRVYEMQDQTLNTTDQKDMTEFFTDLIVKMEEMSPSLKQLVKRLFIGTRCTTVTSLDCPHVSQTTEEFKTVSCKVNKMRNLYESLSNVCVKDILEGNNMYKCSQCNREVRAERQDCFRSLPEILVLNTLRYTYNMVTMEREKVNTHFTFPDVLDMTPYMEETIFPKNDNLSDGIVNSEQYKYELIGVTVHTGTAEGGHYYSFIRDLDSGEKDRWLLFNDTEVRPFDSNQLGSECFGWEQPKPFDNNGERYLDFGMERTNSAYMLLYHKIDKVREQLSSTVPVQPAIPKELQQWVWKDTTDFIQDINVFDRFYFDFLWRLCSSIPQTLVGKDNHCDVSLLTGQLALSFLWETLIHSRDRSQFNNFFELTTKQAAQFPAVADWFLRQIVDDSRWLFTILVQCPVANIRHMFQRFVLNLITRLRPQCNYLDFYAHEAPGFSWQFLIGRFCRQCILYLDEPEVRLHWRNLTDLLLILFEFSKLGWAESWFLITNHLFGHCFHFYNCIRQLKDSRSSMIGPLPLFALHQNILEMGLLNTDEPDNSDRFSPDLEKDKPNALSLMVALLRHGVELFQSNVFHCKLHQGDQASVSFHGNSVQVHSDIEHFMGGTSDQEQLEFLGNLVRDGIDPMNTPRLAAVLFFDKPEKARSAIHYLLQKALDLFVPPPEPISAKKERDNDVQLVAYLNAAMEMAKAGTSFAANLLAGQTEMGLIGGINIVDGYQPVIPEYMDYLLEKMMALMAGCPLRTYQWIGDHARTETIRRWALGKMEVIMEWHGLSIGKPPSVYRDEMQLEVARLLVSLTGEPKLREIFGSCQNGLLLQAAKEKSANMVTAADKGEFRFDDEQHEWIQTVIRTVLQSFQVIQMKFPTVLDPVTSTESYQWIMFALQFLMIEPCEKAQILNKYDFLRGLLVQQLSPDVRFGGNRQAILQLLAAAVHRFPPLVTTVTRDRDLLNRLLDDLKLRGNEDSPFWESYGRYTGASLFLFNVLCQQDGEFAAELAEDPRLLSKLQIAMSLKLHECCRRPLMAIIDTLINHAPYPPGRKPGENFRKALFAAMWAVRSQTNPATNMLISPISKRLMDGGDEDFQTFAIENKALDLLTENFRTCYSTFQLNKVLTYLYEEATWSLSALKKYRAFAGSIAETHPGVKEALTNWIAFAKQLGRDMGVDILAVVEGNSSFDAVPRSIVIASKRK